MSRDVEHTRDRRYIIVDGVLWRATDPGLPEERRQYLVKELMDARRAVGVAKRANDARAESRARGRVHAAKVALGERGPVWWNDGAADLTGKRLAGSCYGGDAA